MGAPIGEWAGTCLKGVFLSPCGLASGCLADLPQEKFADTQASKSRVTNPAFSYAVRPA